MFDTYTGRLSGPMRPIAICWSSFSRVKSALKNSPGDCGGSTTTSNIFSTK